MNEKKCIGIIGLGYVGFPLACLFSKRYKVIGYDINSDRIRNINAGVDSTYEVSEEQLQAALKGGMKCTDNIEDLIPCNIYIVSVPTPIDSNRQPNLDPLINATRTIGEVISKGDIVIYESTVYPGVTEEICIPEIEQVSGLKFNEDFYAGYSPERINPGDKKNTVENICKVTSGSTPEIADEVDKLYNSVLKNGTHRAPSIKVAEASKIVENSQRDINIAFMNEIAKIFNAMDIDTGDVLEAAATKWNFIPIQPGLVGGHCISVDPYYLIQKAQVFGVLPRIMTESRRTNDSMGNYIGNQIVKAMNLNDVRVNQSRILLLGFTFKENCPDTRNTKVIDIYNTLSKYTTDITIYDPWVDKKSAKKTYGVDIMIDGIESLEGTFDAVALCVSHKSFLTLDIASLIREGGVVYDVKGVLDREIVDRRL